MSAFESTVVPTVVAAVVFNVGLSNVVSTLVSNSKLVNGHSTVCPLWCPLSTLESTEVSTVVSTVVSRSMPGQWSFH